MSDDLDKVQKRNFRRRRALRQDYCAVFGTEAGGRVLADLFRSCLIDNVGYIQRDTALHSQGRRWVFARIYKMMNMKDDELVELTKENV
jgi:hypothetical protein